MRNRKHEARRPDHTWGYRPQGLRAQRGSVTLEFALVTPALVGVTALLLSLLSVGVAVSSAQLRLVSAVTHAARGGVSVMPSQHPSRDEMSLTRNAANGTVCADEKVQARILGLSLLPLAIPLHACSLVEP